MNPRVLAVKYESSYKLILTFNNGEIRKFDISPYLIYPVYEILKDENYCQKANVYLGTVVWNDYTDFDPDTLYIESKPMAEA